MKTPITASDAHALLVKWMRKGPPSNHSTYGYDLYLPAAISEDLGNVRWGEIELILRDNMPALQSAAWDLCRRGILRPSPRGYGDQGNPDGFGYSITSLGASWLSETNDEQFFPTEPGQLAARLAKHRARFGDGYHQRAQEAAKCYHSNAFLGCCSMCGAAAESILLGAAIAKSSADDVIQIYRTASGRHRIQKLVLKDVSDALRTHADAQLSLLKYWRDDSSHGQASPISEVDAHIALLTLIRMAALFDDSWADFTA